MLVLVASVGVWLLLGSGDDTSPTASDTAATDSAPASPKASESKEPKPSPKPSEGKPGKPDDVARSATAKVPATAPPNEDVDGNMVRYEGRNMLDGVPETTWRMAGDGTGETITFDLAEPTTISEVGMINGYAKTANDGGRELDWYTGNRRVLEVGVGVRRRHHASARTSTNTRNLQTIEGRRRHHQLGPAPPRVRVEARFGSRRPATTPPISEVSLVGTPA